MKSNSFENHLLSQTQLIQKKKMAKTAIATVASLCIVLSIGLINAAPTMPTEGIPKEFLENHSNYLLSPVTVDVHENRKVFKFGNAEKRK